MSVKQKFYILRFVASLQILLGGLLCIFAVVIFFSGLNAPSILGVSVTLLAMWLFFGGLMTMVVGELCYVFLGIEENTRTTSELLQIYLQKDTTTLFEEENKRKFSISSVRESIVSELNSELKWNKEKSIIVGIFVVLIIVIFALKQLGLMQ